MVTKNYFNCRHTIYNHLAKIITLAQAIFLFYYPLRKNARIDQYSPKNARHTEKKQENSPLPGINLEKIPISLQVMP